MKEIDRVKRFFVAWKNAGCFGGCLFPIFCALIFTAIWVAIFPNKELERKKQEQKAEEAAYANSLVGRSYAVAEKSGMTHAGVEITQQVDNMQRVKVNYQAMVFGGDGAKAKCFAYSQIRQFFLYAGDVGGFEQVSSFWFNPMGKVVDQYGNESQDSLGKLVLPREAFLKMNWRNATPQMIERLFETEGVNHWIPME